MKVDTKDIRIGFWVALGFFLFSMLAGLLLNLIGKARRNG